MLLVKTQIKSSAIDGIGLFADEFIPKGTPVWKYCEGFDIKVPPNQIDKLSPPSREQFLKYAYLNDAENLYVLCFDDARFFNHSTNPNCTEIPSNENPEGINIASSDIQKGEELTCDYALFDLDHAAKLMKI